MSYLFDNSNLRTEMVKRNITKKQLADIINIPEHIVFQKFSGTYDWKYSECLIIKNLLFPDMELEYLFQYNKVDKNT